MPLDLLSFFVERRGELITRQDILDRLWGREVSLDADRAINNTIRKVRSALGDDPDRPTYVETVIGRGYRFVAPVDVAEPAATAVAATAALPIARRRWIPAAAAALALLAAAGGLLA